MELYENRDQDQYGLEIDARSPEIGKILSVFYNICWMNSSLVSNGVRVRNREHPAVISNGGFHLARAGFDLNILGKYVSEFESVRFASPADGPQALGNFFTMDITCGYTINILKSVRTYINLYNITDQKYSTVVGYPDFGRRLSVGATIVI